MEMKTTLRDCREEQSMGGGVRRSERSGCREQQFSGRGKIAQCCVGIPVMPGNNAEPTQLITGMKRTLELAFFFFAFALAHSLCHLTAQQVQDALGRLPKKGRDGDG